MSVPVSGDRWPLVGRDAELRAFDQAWKIARLRCVVIAGSAGVGKSRLAQDCFARAVVRGARGERVTASMAAAAVPLGAAPWHI